VAMKDTTRTEIVTLGTVRTGVRAGATEGKVSKAAPQILGEGMAGRGVDL